MALIGKIRKNSWLLIALIALGLGGFIIMDMTSGQQSVFGSSQFVMGEIEGEKVDWGDFNRTEQMLYGNSGGDIYGRRDYLWGYYIEDALVRKEAEALGLGVSQPELMDLQFGPNPSVIIQQRFTNPQTGQLDRERLLSFKTALEDGSLAQDKQSGPFWAHQEKEIIKQRLQDKINNMVSKAMFTPSWMVEKIHSDQNTKLDFAYVQVPFSEVADSDIKVEESDYQSYLNANKAKYVLDEEARKVSYTVFDVLPTAADSANLKQALAETMEEFRQTDDDSTFVDNNYGTIDGAYVFKAALNNQISDTLFKAPLGTVVGPYIDGRNYKAVKLIDRKVIADSVRSRHILLSANDRVSYAAAQRTIDSLKALLVAGTHRFDSLAMEFSQGPTSVKGGDLGYAAMGQMVKPFNDLIFFDAEIGEYNSVISQFGVHLVEVLDRKFINNDEGVKVAYLEQLISPSEETQKAMFNKVNEFVSKNTTLEALTASVASNDDLELEVSPGLKRNDFTIGTLGGGNTSRDIVRWAYSGDAEVGKVCPTVYVYQDPVDFFENKYVVVALKNIQEPGRVSVADVKEEIAATVKNLKKAEVLQSRVTSTDLNSLAATFGTQVDTASGVKFVDTTVPGLGAEPEVLATAFQTNMNTASKPITGNNGLYVVKPLSIQNASPMSNIPQFRKILSSTSKSRVPANLFEAIKKNADIEDNRSRFY